MSETGPAAPGLAHAAGFEPGGAAAACARYEAVRALLPAARYPERPHARAHLGEAAEGYGGLLLDAYGVLNVGAAPVPGAPERLRALRRAGTALLVLSNAASYTPARALAKYRALGFDFAPEEVLTSREVAAARLEALAPGARWAALSDEGDDYADLPAEIEDAALRPAALEEADGVLFLSATRYGPAMHARLTDALIRRPRPIVVANPDIVSPREAGLAREPGFFAHEIAARTGAPVHWFGKPFGAAFADAFARIGLPPARLAMVGDTLHTDVLGGRAAGTGTILVTGHGLFAGIDPAPYVEASGIVPDVVIPTV